VKLKICEKENCFLIEVDTDEEVAIAVYTEETERIYLPTEASSDSTYYVERSEALVETDSGYRLKIDERPHDVKVLN